MEKETKDNWKHRAKNMTCWSCMWWLEKKIDRPVQEGFVSLGRCRKHSPTISGFPAVFQNDWCGDHKLSEDKV